MEITPALLEAITRQVLLAMKNRCPQPALPNALLFGDAAYWTAHTAQYTWTASTELQSPMASCTLLLIDGITAAELCDLAGGRDDTLLTNAASKALLTGKPVYLTTEGLPHRAYKETASPAYYAMLEEAVARLGSFGVRIGTREAILEQLLQSQNTPKAVTLTSPAPQSDLVEGLVTAERARMLARDCGGRLRLAQSAKLTPLARDVLREKKIALDFPGEEAAC